VNDFELDAEHLQDLIAAAKAALAAEGVLVTIQRRTLSLTASSEGGAWMVLAIALPSGSLAWFGQQIAKSVDSRVRTCFSALRKSSVGVLMLQVEGVRVFIEPDLPDDAILQLVEPLPDAPSGELRYDQVRQTWVDSNDWKGNGGG